MFVPAWWMILVVECAMEIESVYGTDRVLVKLPSRVKKIHYAKAVRYGAINDDGRVDLFQLPAAVTNGKGDRFWKEDRYRGRPRHGHFARVLRVSDKWPGNQRHVSRNGQKVTRLLERNKPGRHFRGQRGHDNDASPATTAVHERVKETTDETLTNCSNPYRLDEMSSVSIPPQIVKNVYYTLDPVVPYL